MHEIANVGLGAPTAKIARRAGVAAGTLFTYFAHKEELLNELYFELKGEVYTRINANFPNKGSPERRARHICSSVLNWAIEFPEKRKAAVQLNVSDLITPETCMRTAAQRETIESALCGLPPGFATATMAAMQEQQWNSSRNSRSSAKSSLSRLFKSSGGRGDEIVVRPNKRVTRSRTHVRSLGRSGLLDLMAGRREGHWLPANGKYSGISSKKIAALSTICQIWRNEIDISATSSAC